MSADSGTADESAGSTGFPDVWIDATRAASAWQVWGMSLVERQVREASLRGSASIIVWATSDTAAAVSRVRADLYGLYSTSVAFLPVESAEKMYTALERIDAPVLLLEGDVVYDDRILSHLWDVGADSVVKPGEGVAAIHLSPNGARRLAATLHQDRAGFLATAAEVEGAR